MNISSRALVELILLGPTNDRRQLQDSPVLGDVWIAFAAKPSEALDLLITPHKERPAGPVAALLAKRIKALKLRPAKSEKAHIAYLQGLVAASLYFEELLLGVVPLTKWWKDQKIPKDYVSNSELKTKIDEPQADAPQLRDKIQWIVDWAQAKNADDQAKRAEKFADFTSLDRYLALAGIILWFCQLHKLGEKTTGIGEELAKLEGPDAVLETLRKLFADLANPFSPELIVQEPQIFQVSLNRRAMPALDKSVPAVKGDAARTLFNVKCDSIHWAILDSGIDDHKALRDKNGKSRILKAYDFSNIRKIVSLDNLDSDTDEFKERVVELRAGRDDLDEEEAAKILSDLAKDAENDRPIHWELVEKFIEIREPRAKPASGHGTHVAGIIGAAKYKREAKLVAGTNAVPAADDTESSEDDTESSDDGAESSDVEGMCPDIKFYDFRVLSKTLQDTEFAIIAALQFLRYLNDRHTYMSIHGANLSLSIPHDVRNFACGRTPICNECERLVESGVVVVAAAGNLGYQRFETQEGSYEGYTAFSITDPGNADGVITVGATHRYRPHTYGVSFFSSRGPTGDGRLKPDLVAPGERIRSCLLGHGWGELDGTSMAAPHVSGAAAMLMARYTELIGEPRRIKSILCESATELGRERSFQGHGMLDVLRAFQRV